MPDQTRGQDEYGKPDHDPGIQGQPLISDEKEQSTKHDEGPRQDYDKTENLERDIRSGEWWLIGISIATLIVNVVIASIYYGQLRQMTIATQAAKDAVTQSRTNNADAIKAQQQIASESLNASQENFRRSLTSSDVSTQKTLAEMRAQNKATEDMARATHSVADTSRNSMETQERAWVGFGGGEEGSVEDDVLHHKVTIENFGRGPAFEIATKTGYTKVEPDFRSFSQLTASPSIPVAAIIMPGSTASISNDYSLLDNLDFKERQAFQDGRISVYLLGTITYKDIFTKGSDKNRITNFCVYWNQQKKRWHYCNNVFTDAE